jgi:rhamnose transport system ATP-binding protein
LAGPGLAILAISSDLPEVLTIADRVLVMREGAIVREFAAADATEEAIMLAATGQEADAA